MTIRLYDLDSHTKEFTAKVISCVPREGAWEVILDRTAFFPGGGGQKPDTGLIAGIPAEGWGEWDREILHKVSSPLSVGEEVTCAIDWENRFPRMQQHSGEHIVSGLIHKMFGWENTGFHMSESDLTVDFSGPMEEAELRAVEDAANRAVWENVPVTVEYPAPEALSQMEYRSKLDLKENVRIVTVAGYDRCACCAPHVKATGEVGPILILSHQPLRGGTRIHLAAGKQAWEILRNRVDGAQAVSALLSVPAEDIAGGVERYKAAHEAMHAKYAEEKRKALEAKLAALTAAQGALLIFEEGLSSSDLRMAVNRGVPLTKTICAAFSGTDDTGYSFVMGSDTVDLRAGSRAICAALGGRGGGKPDRIEGKLSAKREDIEAYFKANY